MIAYLSPAVLPLCHLLLLDTSYPYDPSPICFISAHPNIPYYVLLLCATCNIHTTYLWDIVYISIWWYCIVYLPSIVLVIHNSKESTYTAATQQQQSIGNDSTHMRKNEHEPQPSQPSSSSSLLPFIHSIISFYSTSVRRMSRRYDQSTTTFSPEGMFVLLVKKIFFAFLHWNNL